AGPAVGRRETGALRARRLLLRAKRVAGGGTARARLQSHRSRSARAVECAGRCGSPPPAHAVEDRSRWRAAPCGLGLWWPHADRAAAPRDRCRATHAARALSPGASRRRSENAGARCGRLENALSLRSAPAARRGLRGIELLPLDAAHVALSHEPDRG